MLPPPWECGRGCPWHWCRFWCTWIVWPSSPRQPWRSPCKADSASSKKMVHDDNQLQRNWTDECNKTGLMRATKLDWQGQRNWTDEGNEIQLTRAARLSGQIVPSWFSFVFRHFYQFIFWPSNFSQLEPYLWDRFASQIRYILWLTCHVTRHVTCHVACYVTCQARITQSAAIGANTILVCFREFK